MEAFYHKKENGGFLSIYEVSNCGRNFKFKRFFPKFGSTFLVTNDIINTININQ